MPDTAWTYANPMFPDTWPPEGVLVLLLDPTYRDPTLASLEMGDDGYYWIDEHSDYHDGLSEPSDDRPVQAGYYWLAIPPKPEG